MSLFGDIASAIGEAASDTVGALVSVVTETYNAVAEAATEAAQEVEQTWSEVSSDISAVAAEGDIAGTVAATIGGAVSGTIATIGHAIDFACDFLGVVIGGNIRGVAVIAAGFVRALVITLSLGVAVDLARRVGQGIIDAGNGLSSVTVRVLDALGDFVESILVSIARMIRQLYLLARRNPRPVEPR